MLADRGMVATELKTKCGITLDVETLTITHSELTLKAKIPGTDAAKFGCLRVSSSRKAVWH